MGTDRTISPSDSHLLAPFLDALLNVGLFQVAELQNSAVKLADFVDL
jgi:hypothetical protein